MGSEMCIRDRSRAFAKLRESGVETEGNRAAIADLEALRAVAAGER